MQAIVGFVGSTVRGCICIGHGQHVFFGHVLDGTDGTNADT